MEPKRSIKELIEVAITRPEDLDRIKEIVYKSPGVTSEIDDDGRTAFHWACSVGNIKTATFLYETDNSVLNKSDEDGWTPLHSSASAGHSLIVRFLLSCPINKDVQTSTGGTALHYASSNGRAEIVSLLVSAGFDINIQDSNGHTPIGKAVCRNQEEIVEYFIKKKAKLDMKETGTGDNLLHIAVNNKSVEIGCLLFDADQTLAADPNSSGLCPADVATTTELLQWKAIKEGTGETPATY